MKTLRRFEAKQALEDELSEVRYYLSFLSARELELLWAKMVDRVGLEKQCRDPLSYTLTKKMICEEVGYRRSILDERGKDGYFSIKGVQDKGLKKLKVSDLETVWSEIIRRGEYRRYRLKKRKIAPQRQQDLENYEQAMAEWRDAVSKLPWYKKFRRPKKPSTKDIVTLPEPPPESTRYLKGVKKAKYSKKELLELILMHYRYENLRVCEPYLGVETIAQMAYQRFIP